VRIGPIASLLALVAACNPFYGIEETKALPDADVRPDRDRDGIADVIDPCIAPASDDAIDFDKDGLTGAADSCPLLAPDVDTDGDGLSSGFCDPFPTIPGDRLRCAMFFTDLFVSSELWQARPGEQPFFYTDGGLLGTTAESGLGSVVAMDRIIPETGTSTIDVVWGPVPFTPDGLDDTYAFGIWISAGDVASASDVACGFRNEPSQLLGTIIGVASPPLVKSGRAKAKAAHVLRAVIQPGKAGTNVSCTLTYTDQATGEPAALTTTAHFDGPLRAQGLTASQGFIFLNAVITYHTDEQPPL
jgi:hypothetical protein